MSAIKVHTEKQFRDEYINLIARIIKERKENEKLIIYNCNFDFDTNENGNKFIKQLRIILTNVLKLKQNYIHIVHMVETDEDKIGKFMLVICSIEDFENEIKPMLEEALKSPVLELVK